MSELIAKHMTTNSNGGMMNASGWWCLISNHIRFDKYIHVCMPGKRRLCGCSLRVGVALFLMTAISFESLGFQQREMGFFPAYIDQTHYSTSTE